MGEEFPGAVAEAGTLTPPTVPPGTIEVPPGNELFLVGHAIGSQNYICLPLQSPAAGFDWVLFTPQATLFTHGGHQIITHFASPAPPKLDPTNPIPTWQANDNSTVWATREKSMDSPTGSIPWLLLKVVATSCGKDGGHRLAGTAYIQRVNTTGGTKPPTGCSASAAVGNKNCAPYTADYYFYRATHSD